MSTYTPAHKRYYKKHKDTIYRRTKKYKSDYNRDYYQRRKLEAALKEAEHEGAISVSTTKL